MVKLEYDQIKGLNPFELHQEIRDIIENNDSEELELMIEFPNTTYTLFINSEEFTIESSQESDLSDTYDIEDLDDILSVFSTFVSVHDNHYTDIDDFSVIKVFSNVNDGISLEDFDFNKYCDELIKEDKQWDIWRRL